MNYATASHDTYLPGHQAFLQGHPPREGSARESTPSLSPGAALVMTLLYSAGLWAGIWLTVAGLLW